MKKWWRIWARSLGEKVGETDTQADIVAGIRTFWWVIHIFTCFMIIIRRAIALRNARDCANNDEFKKLWDKKLVQLILEWKE